MQINLPPLIERQSDIPLLVKHFLKKFRPDQDLAVPFEEMQQLLAYHWPGNVRELENVIQRAVVMARKNIITIGNLESEPSETDITTYLSKELKSGLNFKEIISRIEKELIYSVLNETQWNRTKAADKLQMHRRLLYSKMKEYEL